MHGTVERNDGSEGKYVVPIVLIYPDDSGNGVAAVDWLITIDLHQGGFTASAGEWTPSRFALRATYGYLFENGFTYATVQWDKGVTDYFGPAAPDGTLNEDGTFDTDLDEVGNALGGLRLPHMEQIIDGTTAGAPLGRYTGKHPEGGPEQLFWYGGYFEPFTDEEPAERYPDHETYIKRVTHTADYLLEAGYILEDDRDEFVREATKKAF